MAETWLLCTACRTPIDYGEKYFQCSVSTCNRVRMRLVFCSVPCWDSHVADARHRDAWAEDKIAPTQAAWEREQASQPAEPSKLAAPAPRPAAPQVRSAVPTPVASPGSAPVRRVVGEPAPAPAAAAGTVHLHDIVDRDMMIVVSKLKKYIKDRSGMNCSDAVADVLSDHVRVLCDDAIRAAGRDERKTVLDRDVARPRRP